MSTSFHQDEDGVEIVVDDGGKRKRGQRHAQSRRPGKHTRGEKQGRRAEEQRRNMTNKPETARSPQERQAPLAFPDITPGDDED